VTITSPDLAAVEGIEAEFMYRYESDAPEATREQLGIKTARIGGGVALSVRNDPTKFWSKALGFGFDEPVTGDLIEELLAFYRSNQATQAVIQIAPDVLPADWDEIVAAHGLRPGSGINKLLARIEELQFGSSDLRIDEAGPEHAEEWATVALTAFGMPWEGLGDMMISAVTRGALRPFGAWDGDRMVAVGGLLVQGPLASLNTGATLAEYRGRGAQSGLIAARLKAAAAAGSEWVVSETAESGSSLNNMRRAGLSSLYVRRNWLWTA
jgi:hypothetical protein